MCDNTLVVTVPGTMKAHAAVPVGTSHVSLRDMSCNCSECLIDVEFMEKAGKLNDTFKWPTKVDVLLIKNDAILCCIPKPNAKRKSIRMFQVS